MPTFQWCPKGPSICLLDKQTSGEARRVLYSTTVFRFSCDGYTLQSFEATVGQANLDFIRRSEISLDPESFSTTNSARLYFEQFVARDPNALTNTCNAKALYNSGIQNITEMTILANKYQVREVGLTTCGFLLESAICIFLKTNPEANGGQGPYLRLAGYLDSERDRFLERFNIKTEILDYTTPGRGPCFPGAYDGPDLHVPEADMCWYGQRATRGTELSFDRWMNRFG